MRDANAAEQFFRKVLVARRTTAAHSLAIDQNAAYPPAFGPPESKLAPRDLLLRPCKYLNNVVEQKRSAREDWKDDGRAQSTQNRSINQMFGFAA
jgi:transposase-like protein